MDQNRNKNNQKRIEQNKKSQSSNDLFQFEMGNELGAELEQDKTMFKNEYCKDSNVRQRNNQTKNQRSKQLKSGH